MKEYLALFDLDGTLFDTREVNFFDDTVSGRCEMGVARTDHPSVGAGDGDQ